MFERNCTTCQSSIREVIYFEKKSMSESTYRLTPTDCSTISIRISALYKIYDSPLRKRYEILCMPCRAATGFENWKDGGGAGPSFLLPRTVFPLLLIQRASNSHGLWIGCPRLSCSSSSASLHGLEVAVPPSRCTRREGCATGAETSVVVRHESTSSLQGN